MEKWRLGVWMPSLSANELREDALAVRATTEDDYDMSGPVCLITPVSRIKEIDLVRMALIMAAPQLKAALEKLVYLHNGEDNNRDQVTAAQWTEAIQQAEAALVLSETLPKINYGVNRTDSTPDGAGN
jgi:lipid A disaccharide synthetase